MAIPSQFDLSNLWFVSEAKEISIVEFSVM